MPSQKLQALKGLRCWACVESLSRRHDHRHDHHHHRTGTNEPRTDGRHGALVSRSMDCSDATWRWRLCFCRWLYSLREQGDSSIERGFDIYIQNQNLICSGNKNASLQSAKAIKKRHTLTQAASLQAAYVRTIRSASRSHGHTPRRHECAVARELRCCGRSRRLRTLLPSHCWRHGHRAIRVRLLLFCPRKAHPRHAQLNTPFRVTGPQRTNCATPSRRLLVVNQLQMRAAQVCLVVLLESVTHAC